MNWQPYLTPVNDVASGKPIVQGTRLTVEFVVGLFAAGWTFAQVREHYPTLSADAPRAVFAYTAEVLRNEALCSLRFDAAWRRRAPDWCSFVVRPRHRQRRGNYSRPCGFATIWTSLDAIPCVSTRDLRGLRDFVSEQGMRVGIVVNNDAVPRHYDDHLIGIPFAWL